MKEGEDIYSSSLVIDNGVIIYIGDNYEKYSPFDKIIDIKNNVIMPGFKNAHAHGAMVFGRALTDGVSLHDWLYDNIFPLEAHLTPKMCYTFTKEAVLEYLTSGITASSEMYYYMDSIALVADQMKYRLHLVIGSTEYLGAKENIDKLNSEYANYDIALHSVYTPTEEEFDFREKYIKENHVPFYVHACETEQEVQDCKKLHNGLTPIQYLDSRGFFDYGGVIYHANYLDEKDYEIIKKHSIIPVTCAGSNAKLASGICPVRELLDRGIPVAIGTDGPASNDSLDMFY
ncbi:MAG: amidohydrolase family protein, partial [Coprobacillus sp.]|nr:amidohydrolase family protein [Coprobacillus sp.]